ncbi:MAG: hypothetical protein AAGU32_22755, partial [Bacillota bacterium]
MKTAQKTGKRPISEETVFKIMQILTYVVTSAFLVKNIIAKEWRGVLVIGACLAILTIVLLLMRAAHAKAKSRHFAVSISLVFVVFFVSTYSGASYSDDFATYLAVMGLAGMFLQPKYTLAQGILTEILLVIQYLLNPEKAGDLSQFILCMATFALAASMLYLVIKRGQSFIQISQVRAEQAETLLGSMSAVGEELQRNFENSSKQIELMQIANTHLETNADDLKKGSSDIAQDAQELVHTFVNVQERMQATETQIGALNGEVKTFEAVLSE